MTPDRVRQLLARYDQQLARMGAGEPLQCDLEAAMTYMDDPQTWKVAAAHLRFACQEAQKFCGDGRVEKAMRWLGFVQGCLWAMGDSSIADLARDNAGG